MELKRRGFLLGLGASLIAAPAIVKIENIMPVRNLPLVITPAPILPGAVTYVPAMTVDGGKVWGGGRWRTFDDYWWVLQRYDHRRQKIIEGVVRPPALLRDGEWVPAMTGKRT
jgi:hypothetical protein